MVVFTMPVLIVRVTDKTPEMSILPLNEASPDVNFDAVTTPLNVGDAVFAMEFKDASNLLNKSRIFGVPFLPMYVYIVKTGLLLTAFTINMSFVWVPLEKLPKSGNNNMPPLKSINQFPPIAPNGKVSLRDFCVLTLYKYGS